MFIRYHHFFQCFVGLSVVFLLTLISGCASVPPESVELSKKVGMEISKSQAAHLSTLDAFFKRLLEENDKWVTDVYVPKLTSNAIAGLAAACEKAKDNSPSCSQLNNNDMKTIIAKTVEFRDGMHRALSTSRDDAVRLINEHYTSLQQSNSVITALLASVVDVKKATKDSASAAGAAVGIKIDTDQIENTVSDFLGKAGQIGVKISDLEASLSAIVNSTSKK